VYNGSSILNRVSRIVTVHRVVAQTGLPCFSQIGDMVGMSSYPVTPEQLAVLPPEVRAVIDAIIEYYERKVATLEAENKALRDELRRAGKTPENSSLPPSSQHPHAKPLRRKEKS